MAGDYSRFSFDVRKNYSRLLGQQGRVGLDSDWNEAADIADRARRSQTLDVLGRCIVPGTTLDAFLPEPTGTGTFSIKPGRLYLDGIQVENHGTGTAEFDAVLGEMRSPAGVPYDDQPFLPAPLPPPISSEAGRVDLVFLEIWQREVSAIEDPAIREVALGGPDTTTRSQTVWQVRVLPDVGAIGCGDPLESWASLTAPSAGRLTTSTIPPVPEDNPCVITPEGGYRGVENRLYRVEVHTPGTIGGAGPAKFKWSADNASLSTSIEKIETLPGAPPRARLTLGLLGRDRVLRFAKDDWVEIVDDHHEFTGRPGLMAKIEDTDPAQQSVVLDREVPAAAFDLADPGGRHTRLRRWDQKDGVDADGLLDVTPGPILIAPEAGVQVEFTLVPAGGGFHVGDYWVFAARTATGRIEELDAAPPRGILHHFCRLALITWGEAADDTLVEDCREHWPPQAGEGCCTVIVRPGESIQAALDALPEEGGCVCLKVGEHRIAEPLRITRSDVVLHGESSGARVLRRNGPALLRIGDPETERLARVRVHDIRFELDPEGDLEADDFALVSVLNARDVAIESCALLYTGPLLGLFQILVWRGSDIAIRDNTLTGLPYGLFAQGDSERLLIAGNELYAPLISLAATQIRYGIYGLWLEEVIGVSIVERNRLEGFERAILLEDRSSIGSRVSGNEVVRTAAIHSDDDLMFAIQVDAADCLIADNAVGLAAPLHGGIAVSDSGCRIEGNRIASSVTDVSFAMPLGIAIRSAVAAGRFADDVLVRGNSLEGVLLGISVVSARHCRLVDNIVRAASGAGADGAAIAPLFGIDLQACEHALVSGNAVSGARSGVALADGRDNRLDALHVRDADAGVHATEEAALSIENCRLTTCSWGGIFAGFLQERVTIACCHVTNCGLTDIPGFGPGGGIWLAMCTARATVAGCEVVDTGLRDREEVTRAAFGIALLFVPDCLVHGNRVSITDASTLSRKRNDRAIVLAGFPTAVFGDRIVAFGSASMLDNRLLGTSALALVEVLNTLPWVGESRLAFEKVTFSNNAVHHLSEGDDQEVASVSLRGLHAIAVGNHVKAESPISSFDFNQMRHVSAIGNVTSGGFLQLPSPTPAPVASFNIIGV